MRATRITPCQLRLVTPADQTDVRATWRRALDNPAARPEREVLDLAASGCTSCNEGPCPTPEACQIPGPLNHMGRDLAVIGLVLTSGCALGWVTYQVITTWS